MAGAERSFRTPALILKRFDLGEADRVLTILTPAHGKLEVVAKGARKLTSPRTGHVELFTRAEMLINSGRELGIVVQAEMVRPYLALRDDLVRGASAGYAAEITDRFVSPGETYPPALFNLLDAAFARIDGDPDPRLALRYFEMHLLDLAGFRPELNECVIGREPVQPQDQFFSYAEGGVVCPRDAVRGTSHVPVSMPTLKIMRHVQRSRYEAVRALQISTALHDDFERVMVGYVTYLLERRPRSADLLRRIR
ncbi:MAG: DNA repair protein RecO [Anaerolineae bacterium]|nr:DNA repair protein RecO [Anaerolineae bacterium]NUQ06512.1 DNA repair protein RecO [Anaerolineae bacterium]